VKRLDILIVTYRSRDTIERLIHSLHHLKSSFVLRVIVHDNSCDKEILERVRRLTANRDIPMSGIVCPANCGFARACNSMASTSTADWFLFLNPDSRVAAWPERWEPNPGVWGPVIVSEAGNRQLSSGQKRSVLTEMGMLFARVWPRPADGSGWVSGAALLVDRQSFERLGGFREDFFMYYEDIDLGLRASDLGIPVDVQRGWVVEHEGGHSVGEDHSAALQRSYQSAIRFHRDRGHHWRAYALGWGLYAGLRSTGYLYPKWRRRSRAFAESSLSAWRDVFRTTLS